MKAVKDAVKGNLQDRAIDTGLGKLKNVISGLELTKAMASAGRMGEELADTIAEQMENEAKEFDFKDVDVTGILGVVDAMENNKPAHEMAAAWLNMLSTFDPTGWLSAAANFAKPQCQSIYDQLDEIDIQQEMEVSIEDLMNAARASESKVVQQAVAIIDSTCRLVPSFMRHLMPQCGR